MKQLTCEMCGSTDLIKQDGVFVCQSCGCKYSVDEAKKLLVEGTVDVSGSTVKVDTSDELANLYQIARRAKDDNNSENAAKYYDMILVKDPTSWEASFYVVYFKAMSCKIAQIRSAAISVSNCQDSVLGLIRDHVPEDEQAAAVKEVVFRSKLIANMLANGAKSHYDGISANIKSNYTQEYLDNACASRDILYICGSQIDQIFSGKDDIAHYAADAWKGGIEIHQRLLSYFADVSGNRKVIASYAERIGKYDPDYAKAYLYRNKKEGLESEITALKNTISKTPTEPKWHGFGIFFIVVGVIMLFMGSVLSSLDATAAWAYVVGIVEIVLGILLGKPNKSVTEKNRATVAAAKAQLEEKQKELDSLTK